MAASLGASRSFAAFCMPTAMHFPASLIDRLSQNVQGFAREEVRDQRSLACMLWMSLQRGRQHSVYPGRFSLHTKDVREIWGSERRMQKVVGSVYFSVLKGTNLGKGYTNAYKACPTMESALRECLADVSADDWINLNGRRMRTLPRAIDSKSCDGKRNSKWKGLHPANSVAIDADELRFLRSQVLAEMAVRRACTGGPGEHWGNDIELERAQERLHSIDAIVKMANNSVCPGAVPIRYSECSTGRLFAQGISLQSAPRVVRAAALDGCWDYDISNCHWALLEQLAARHGVHCAAIQHYLRHKSSVRASLGAEAGVSAESAKQCLLMLLYGANRTTHESGSITQLIQAGPASRLFRSPLFHGLHADLLRARKAILEHLPTRAGWVSNILGLERARRSNPRDLLAHILQGLEAKVLMEVVRIHGGNIQLCMHDGWISRERLSVEQLREIARAAIGMDLDIEECQLRGPSSEDMPGDSLPVDKSVESAKSFGRQPHTSDFDPTRVSNSPSSVPACLKTPEPLMSDAHHAPSGLVVDGRCAWNRRSTQRRFDLAEALSS